LTKNSAAFDQTPKKVLQKGRDPGRQKEIDKNPGGEIDA